MTHYLEARNGYVSFTPSDSGKTVVVVVTWPLDGDDYHSKKKRMQADKARMYYKALLKKGLRVGNKS